MMNVASLAMLAMATSVMANYDATYESSKEPQLWTTSTVSWTSTHTYLECPTATPDCPVKHPNYSTVVVVTTTVCPVSTTATPPPPPKTTMMPQPYTSQTPKPTDTYKPTSVMPPPASSSGYPPAPPPSSMSSAYKPTSGTASPPPVYTTTTSAKPPIPTAGANIHRTGGVMAVVALAAALF